MQSGSPEMAAIAVGGFVAIVGMGVVGLRALATASGRAR
jgi:threonine dehydrogenase-like Zn-dependent dehydrogenase